MNSTATDLRLPLLRILYAVVLGISTLLPAAPVRAAPIPQEPPLVVASYPLSSTGFPLEGPVVIDGALPGVHSAQTADFDGDGDLDIVTTERESGRLIWYRSSGGPEPQFEARPIAQVPGAYMAIAADMNRDSRTDIVLLAVTNVISDNPPDDGAGLVLWFRNDGAPVPGFAQRTLATGLSYPVHGVVGDLDGNGAPDLAVVTTADAKVHWFANQGGSDPGFAPRLVAGGADAAVAVDLGDMDNDGDLDVIAASEDDDRIVWHSNNGSGGFSPNVIRAGSPLGALDGVKTVKAVDLDGDGDLDIAYGLEDGNEVGWYQSSGGAAPQFAQRLISSERNHVKFVTAADIDEDGDQDLFSASTMDGTVAWYRNNGAATPEFTSFVVTSGAAGARYLHFADLDDDGDLDMLTVARDSGQLAWFRNRAPHRTALYPPEAQRVVATSFRMRHMKSADLDRDGDEDLVSIAARELLWHENDGGLPAQLTPRSIPSIVNAGRWIDLGDLDGDGDIDIVAASTDNDLLLWYENSGTRPPVFSERVLSNAIPKPRAILIGDLDGDGDSDIFAVGDGGEGAGRERSMVAWYENNGARPAVFVERILDDSRGFARSIFAADMDRDGDLDLLVADQGTSAVYLYENRGGAPLQFERREVAAGGLSGAQHVHAADMDSDGDLDVLVASEFDNRIAILENLDGVARTFAPRTADNDAPRVHSVYPGDADGDGDEDFVAAIEGTSSIALYLNDGQRPPQFTKQTLFAQALVAHSVSMDDVDEDGDLDVLATARDSNHALYFENRGGHYRFAESSFVVRPADAQRAPLAVLGLTAAHLGRMSDPALEFAALDVRFEDGTGRLLTAAQVAGRVRSLAVYVDSSGNGQFDPAADRLLAGENRMDQASNGILTVPLTVNPPPASAGPGGSVQIFVVAELVGVCGSTGLRLVVRPTGRTVVEGVAGSALLAESAITIAGGGGAPLIDPQSFLRINEIAANGPADDWIELYNSGPYPVDLSGMYLTDDLEEPTKHRIADGIRLKPYSYIVFIADGENDSPSHVSFALSSSGESVGLFDADVRLNRALDVVTFGEQPVNRTSGRPVDGGKAWRTLAEPTPGTPNVLAGLERRYYLPSITKSFGC